MVLIGIFLLFPIFNFGCMNGWKVKEPETFYWPLIGDAADVFCVAGTFLVFVFGFHRGAHPPIFSGANLWHGPHFAKEQQQQQEEQQQRWPMVSRTAVDRVRITQPHFCGSPTQYGNFHISIWSVG